MLACTFILLSLIIRTIFLAASDSIPFLILIACLTPALAQAPEIRFARQFSMGVQGQVYVGAVAAGELSAQGALNLPTSSTAT